MVSTIDKLRGVKKRDFAAEMAKPNDFTAENIAGQMLENKDALGIKERATETPVNATATDKYVAGNALGQNNPQPQPQTPAPADDDYRQKFKSYQDVIDAAKVKDEEEEKKHKQRQTINAIGDGLSALANLYFTTKGAPSARTSGTMDRTEEWYQKMRNQRIADGDRMLNQQIAIDNAQEAYRQAREREKLGRDKLAADNARQTQRDKERREQQAFDNSIALENAKSNRIRAERTGRGGTAKVPKKEEEKQEEDVKKPTEKPTAYYRGWNGKSYGIPKRLYTEGTFSPIYNKIPDDFKTDNASLSDYPDKKEQMLRTIEAYILKTKNYDLARELWERIGRPTGEGDEYKVDGVRERDLPQNKKKKPASLGWGNTNNNTEAEW